MRIDIEAFLKRVDQASRPIDLAPLQEQMHAICDQLPDEQIGPFIHLYAERIKARGLSNSAKDSI